MKKGLALLIFLVAASYAHAAGAPVPASDPSAIHTYGGGDLLEKVFTAIGEILYGKGSSKMGGTFNLLLRLSLTIGAFCCVCLAFFRQKFDPLIRSFFLPGLAIVGLLLTPTTKIAIIDHSAEDPKPKTVNQDVPFFLGKFAVYSSELFNQLRELFARSIGKDGYSWTLRAAEESPFRSNVFSASDPALEENFREFCRECVFRDLGLGLYTREELKDQENLLEFLAENTSNTRLVSYGDQAIPCREAAERLDAALPDEEVAASLAALFGSEPETFLKQRTAIDLLKEEIRSGLEPAQKPGRSFFSIGSMGILALRELFEAILYLIFPLVILLSLLSFGIRMIFHWMKMILWVSTWPIFYVIVDLFLNSVWSFRKGDESLTLASFNRMAGLYDSMEAICFFGLASVPILSWILIRGGAAQISGLASSIQVTAKSEPAPQPVKLETKTIVVEDSSKQTFGGFAQGFPVQQIHSLEQSIRESSEKILQAVERQKGSG